MREYERNNKRKKNHIPLAWIKFKSRRLRYSSPMCYPLHHKGNHAHWFKNVKQPCYPGFTSLTKNSEDQKND